MNDFIIVIKEDPQIQIKTKDILDKNKRIPYNYQLKIRYDTLIQNAILKEITYLMATTIVHIDIELKMEITRIKYLESRIL